MHYTGRWIARPGFFFIYPSAWVRHWNLLSHSKPLLTKCHNQHRSNSITLCINTIFDIFKCKYCHHCTCCNTCICDTCILCLFLLQYKLKNVNAVNSSTINDVQLLKAKNSKLTFMNGSSIPCRLHKSSFRFACACIELHE